MGLPPGWEKRWGYPKRLLEASLRDVIPPEIAARRKQGFALPMAKWMKEDLREIIEDALGEESLRQKRCFLTQRGAHAIHPFQEREILLPTSLVSGGFGALVSRDAGRPSFGKLLML